MAKTSKLGFEDLVGEDLARIGEEDLAAVRSIEEERGMSHADVVRAGLRLLGEQIRAGVTDDAPLLASRDSQKLSADALKAIAGAVCALLRGYAAMAAQEAEEARGAAEELAGLAAGWLAAVEAAPSAEEALRTAVAREESDREAVRLARGRLDRAYWFQLLSVGVSEEAADELDRAGRELRELRDRVVEDIKTYNYGIVDTERCAVLGCRGRVDGYYASLDDALDDQLGADYMARWRKRIREEDCDLDFDDNDRIRILFEDCLVPIPKLAAEVERRRARYI